MTRGEWHQRARQLRAEGLTHAQIARQIGVTQAAVSKALNPERAREWNRSGNRAPGRQEAKNAWQRERDLSEEGRGRCENSVCGQLRGYGSARKGGMYCQSCHDAIADVRRTLTEGCWADGWPIRVISETFAWTGQWVGRQRERGWDLPYRYSTKRQRALQVAA